MTARASSGEVGRAGERRAVLHYLLRGYRILGRNVRNRDGGIDLIVRRGSTVAFVEVKTRSARELGEPWEAVDREKQLRIIRAAQRYLAEQKLEGVTVRFDVVSIVRRRWFDRVERFENAFEAAWESGRPWRLK